MAVIGANLTSGHSETTGTSFVTASVTPTSNNLILLKITLRNGSSINPATPSVSGNGLTWVLVNSIVYDTAGTSRRALFVFRALGASPSSGAITITSSETDTNATWSVDQFSGIDTSGSNGSGSIVQSNINSDETGTNTSITVTLTSSPGAGNGTYGAFGTDGNATWTPGSGFTELSDVASGITLSSSSEWKNSGDQTVDATASAAGGLGAVGIEIKAASTSVYRMMSRMMMGIGN